MTEFNKIILADFIAAMIGIIVALEIIGILSVALILGTLFAVTVISVFRIWFHHRDWKKIQENIE